MSCTSSYKKNHKASYQHCPAQGDTINVWLKSLQSQAGTRFLPQSVKVDRCSQQKKSSFCVNLWNLFGQTGCFLVAKK